MKTKFVISDLCFFYIVDNLKWSVASFIASGYTKTVPIVHKKHLNDPEIPLSKVTSAPLASSSNLMKFKISSLQDTSENEVSV